MIALKMREMLLDDPVDARGAAERGGLLRLCSRAAVVEVHIEYPV